MHRKEDITNRVGKARGHNSVKENRVQKLINNWDMLENKLIRIIKRGHGISLSARCAYGLLLIMETGIRTGNESSAEGYVCNQKHHVDFGKPIKVYGLVTLLPQHLRLVNGKLYISFLGKKAVKQSLSTQHNTLVHFYNIIRSLSHNPFLGITYRQLRKFTSRYVGNEFTPKDIRTARVNLEFIARFDNNLSVKTKREAKKYMASIIQDTAEKIGHTKGVCKKSYLSGNLLQYCMDKLQE